MSTRSSSTSPEPARRALLDRLADRIQQVDCPHPRRIAIDGIDAAGKTCLADELAEHLADRGCPVIRASLDGFHRPRAERYRRGQDSPEGYYLDSFDYPALCQALLIPLGPGGDPAETGFFHYRRAVFDYRNDAPLHLPAEAAPAQAVLLFDGVFLLRPELNPYWDLRIFVAASIAAAERRALQRDSAFFDSPQALRERYRQRYFPAQRFYLQTVRPQALAEVVVDNDDLSAPRLLERSPHL